MIAYNHITIQYQNQQVLNNFSLRIQERQKVLIAGKSGIGKTTLLKLLLGFEFPDSGTVLYRGQIITAKNIWTIRQEIAYLPQDVIVGRGTVIDSINAYFSFKALAHLKPDRRKISEHLAYFELERDILEKSLDDLSGGEKQRIAIIIAVLLDRKVFLLDEATSALDNALKAKVANYFCEQSDTTLLCISHDREWRNHPHIRVYNLENQQWEQ